LQESDIRKPKNRLIGKHNFASIEEHSHTIPNTTEKEGEIGKGAYKNDTFPFFQNLS